MFPLNKKPKEEVNSLFPILPIKKKKKKKKGVEELIKLFEEQHVFVALLLFVVLHNLPLRIAIVSPVDIVVVVVGGGSFLLVSNKNKDQLI